MISSLVSADYQLFYQVSKGSKNIGTYTMAYGDKSIDTYATGASSKISFFYNKKIDYIEDGYKQVLFFKNKTTKTFDIKTKVSILSEDIQKKYKRKIKKVKGDEFLLITIPGKNNIELFNKRKTIILTLEEVLKKILNKTIKEEKFLLFDKLGVMKMIAEIKIDKNKVIIHNRSKDKSYIAITVKDNKPVSIESLVSDWNLKLILGGESKTHILSGSDIAKRLISELTQNINKNVKIVASNKFKIGKKYTSLKYDIFYPLTDKSECKKRAKLDKVQKIKKIKIKNEQCKVSVKSKILSENILEKIANSLSQKYPQLKKTKNLKIEKNEIIFTLIK
jgi:hypothetical protein